VSDLKRRALQLSSSKQIKLFGNSVAISKSLEIGEGYAPNILSVIEEQPDLKAGLRQYGQLDPKIFGQEATKTPAPGTEKPGTGHKRKRSPIRKGWAVFAFCYSFYHAGRYVSKKPGAELLDYLGVRGYDYKLMAEDFIAQSELRPSKQKACLHAALSFYPGEKPWKHSASQR
jgi:hypothetical protein